MRLQKPTTSYSIVNKTENVPVLYLILFFWFARDKTGLGEQEGARRGKEGLGGASKWHLLAPPCASIALTK
jgi:hypothetical protein